METEKQQVVEQIENVFKDLGGFSWEQAETWASFCFAVGMDPLPQLKVMMNTICSVMPPSSGSIPEKTDAPELWLEIKGHKIHFKIVILSGYFLITCLEINDRLISIGAILNIYDIIEKINICKC